MCELSELFRHADIDGVYATDDDKVYLEAVIRTTGVRLMVEGDDLADACDLMLCQVESQVHLLAEICADYHLTVDEIRALVNEPPVTTSQYAFSGDEYAAVREAISTARLAEDMPKLVVRDMTASDPEIDAAIADMVEPGLDREDREPGDLPPDLLDHALLAAPLTLVAAQPFLAIDGQTDDLYLALRLPRPAELIDTAGQGA